MAVSSVPYALQNGSHSADLFRQATSSLVLPGGGLVTIGDLRVTQTGTASMNVVIGVGRAWIPGTNVGNVTGGNFSKQAMYFALNDAAYTASVAASDPINPRIDVVYLAVNDSQYAGSTDSAVIAVATGVPASGASYPANAPGIPNNAIALAWINVAANAASIGSGNITNLAAPFNIRHAEFTGNTSPTSGALWGPGTLTLDSSSSINPGFATSPSNDRIALSAGVYSVFCRYVMSVAATGTSFGAIVNDGNTNTFTSTDIAAGYSTVSVQRGNINLTSAQNIRFTFSSNAATGFTLATRIAITKIA